jgi:hypothetical protein
LNEDEQRPSRVTWKWFIERASRRTVGDVEVSTWEALMVGPPGYERGM